MSDSPSEKGARAYQEWRDAFMADPENRRLYEQEAVKAERWLRSAERWYTVRRWLVRLILIIIIVLILLAWRGNP